MLHNDLRLLLYLKKVLPFYIEIGQMDTSYGRHNLKVDELQTVNHLSIQFDVALFLYQDQARGLLITVHLYKGAEFQRKTTRSEERRVGKERSNGREAGTSER